MSDKSTLEILTEARALLARPWGWTRRAFQKDQHDTVAYCAVGALRVAAWGSTGFDPNPNSKDSRWAPWGALGALASTAERNTTKAAASRTVLTTNDQSTKKEVLAWFDRAIALAGAEAGNTPAQRTVDVSTQPREESHHVPV